MIKTLSIHDISIIKTLFSKVFSQPPWNDQWDDDQLNLYLHDLISQTNSLTFGYFKDGKLLGISLGYIFHWWTDTEYFIKEFCIDNEIQHQGFGSLFLNAIEQELSKLDMTAIFLSTD